jgi:uncharacterized protein (TIGR02466 family)
VDDVAELWPTPLLRRRLPEADEVNADLRKTFLDFRARKGGEGPVFASPDDLLQRFQRRSLKTLFRFASDAVFDLAQAANRGVWSEGPSVTVGFVGAWFQTSNRYGRHGIHTHGNCSWSGVYYVDVDPDAAAHPTLGAHNGATRFHGPYSTFLAGAHQDVGNVYLQDGVLDVAPEPGLLVLFPSWLPHEVLPYDGARDRVIVSFNAVLQGGGAPPSYGF